MRRMALPLVLLAATVLGLPPSSAAPVAREEVKAKKQKPADRVVVMYFHRTQRCPTCRKMGAYSEEAVMKGFTRQVADGTVEFRFVDFQSPKNAALAKGYKVTGPSLIVAKIAGGKVVEAKNLKGMWAKSGNKPAFLKYVRDTVVACRKPTPKTARKPGPTSPSGHAK